MSEDNRTWIVRQVQAIASLRKVEAAEVWGDLYRDFGYRHNIAFTRMAYVADRKVIDVIQEEGFLDYFAEFVNEELKRKTPALPAAKEKAPVQGSLLGEGEQ